MTLSANATPIAFIYTADRARSLPFYTGTLGLRLVDEDPFAATLDCQGLVLRLATIESHRAGEHPVLCWQVGDVQQVVEALAAKGVACLHYPGYGQDSLGIWSSPDGGTKMAWFPDPEGNLLMVVQRG